LVISPEVPQDFFNLFQEVHPVPEGVHQHSTLDPTEAYAVDAAEASFKDLLDAIFCRSWTAYTKEKEETLCQLELQEFVESQLKEQATVPMAMDVDLITTGSPELADAVKAQVAKHTKSLQSQVSGLTNKLSELKPCHRALPNPAPSQKRRRIPPCTQQNCHWPPKKPPQLSKTHRLQDKASTWERKQAEKEEEQTKRKQLLVSLRVDQKITAVYDLSLM
jgi:hypothetical protein